jgi:hypothetical protein
MAHGMARKLTRAAALSLLVFATASGVAGLEVLAASPAMAEPSQGSPFDPNQDQRPSDPAQGGSGSGQHDQTPPSNGGPTDGLLGGLTGGGLLGGGGSGGSGGH